MFAASSRKSIGSPRGRSGATALEPYAEAMLDAELALRGARRPLVIGMGGGGDVVGAFATAELARRYDGSTPLLGGLAWERRPIDPVPGPRRVEEMVAVVQQPCSQRGRVRVLLDFLRQGTMVDVPVGLVNRV